MDPALIFSGISALKDIVDVGIELIHSGKPEFPPQQDLQQQQQQQQRQQQFDESSSGDNDTSIRSHHRPQPSPEREEKERAAYGLMSIIDEDLLKVMSSNLEKAKARLKSALSDASNSNQAKDQEMIVAQCTICGELKRIRQLNGGNVFPAHQFENLWLSFSCASVAP